MTADVMRPRFPVPSTPSDGAWCVAVALAERADLTQKDSTIEVLLTELFPSSELLDASWRREVIGRACKYTVMVYENSRSKNPNFDLMPFFSHIGYRSNPSRIIATFNPEAQSQFYHLQSCIGQLTDLYQLNPISLQARLKSIAPLTVFDMKKDKDYKEADFTALVLPNRQSTIGSISAVKQ